MYAGEMLEKEGSECSKKNSVKQRVDELKRALAEDGGGGGGEEGEGVRGGRRGCT